jgi:hypothetical protein
MYNTNMTLIEKRNSLFAERMKMDKFFTMFLDKFDRKMDPEKPNTPIWKLYRQKHDEYCKLTKEINYVNYWIAKESNV